MINMIYVNIYHNIHMLNIYYTRIPTRKLKQNYKKKLIILIQEFST